MKKQNSCEAYTANHAHTQIQNGSQKFGGMRQTFSKCILAANESYFEKDACNQALAHEKFEAIFENSAAQIEREDVDYQEMVVTDNEHPEYEMGFDPYDISANDPYWEPLTDLFMGEPTLRVSEY
jgi:hypothetical protein